MEKSEAKRKLNNTYFLVRHGSTVYQEGRKKIIYPWPELKPIVLTEKGIKQAKKAGERLKKEKVDLIYSSDIPRARQTAEIIAKEIKREPNFSRALREIDTGIFQGKGIKSYWQFLFSSKNPFSIAPPKGESLKECQNRVFSFWRKLEREYKKKKIIIVSHGAPLWLLEAKIKGWSWKEAMQRKSSGYCLDTGEIRVVKTS